jgi:hypothetical protein
LKIERNRFGGDAMSQYEYKTKSVSRGSYWRKRRIFKELGRQGWQLVSERPRIWRREYTFMRETR